MLIRKLSTGLHRWKVQGVVFEGTPEGEEKQERVRTGLGRSAGKRIQQSTINPQTSFFFFCSAVSFQGSPLFLLLLYNNCIFKNLKVKLYANITW